MEQGFEAVRSDVPAPLLHLLSFLSHSSEYSEWPNLYVFVGNQSVSHTDFNGLIVVPCEGVSPRKMTFWV